MAEESEEEKSSHLEWRDYVAIFIASLETTLLPLLVSMVVLILVVLALRR